MPVAQGVFHDAPEQGPEVSFVRDAEAGTVAQELDEGLLDEVLGLRLGPETGPHPRSHLLLEPRQVAPDQRFQGPLVSFVPLVQQPGGLSQWGMHMKKR